MEPIPETREAIEEYGPFGDGDLIDDLRERSLRVRAVVPDCLGFSVASQEHGLTFTLLATHLDLAVLDAVQYLTGGPCVALVEEANTHPDGYALADLLDEHAWQLFGRASAAKGVRSTLTLPILKDHDVVGSVNLYGASDQAFTGHHRALAAIFDAWAPGAVTNADLSFASLREARRAPQLMKEETTIQVAIGIIVAREALTPKDADEQLREAAVRAGVDVHELAEAVIVAHGRRAG